MNLLTKTVVPDNTSIPFCEHGGCLAKLPGLELVGLVDGARALSNTIEQMPAASAPEDAAIVEVGGVKLLLTTDFGPLVGVDGFIAGKIAALHALSDIYVMGGKPTHALITFVVARSATNQQAQSILAGVFAACASENVVAAGGHTIVGEDFLVGLAALGIAPASGEVPKQACRDGDVLMVSKPFGTSMTVRSVFHGILGRDSLEEAIDVMTLSNGPAASAAAAVGVHAMTDVTGFGLLGHLSEMLRPDQGATIDLSQIPLLESVVNLNPVAAHTQFTSANLEYARRRHKLILGTQNIRQLALLDPQTNGAVLVAVASDKQFVMREHGFRAIGFVNNSGNIQIK